MIAHSLIIDDWLPNFPEWRRWADTLEYADVVNPHDGVAYPGIYSEVPRYGTEQRLAGVMGTPVRIRELFLRLSTYGVQAPQQAHSDTVMGQWTILVYMNRQEHCQGGTALLRHCTGIDTTAKDERELEIVVRDQNIPAMWHQYSMCEMRENRAFIFRADLMHCALPIEGFGTDATNGRLVLCGFFEC